MTRSKSAFSEFSGDEHRAQAEELFLELGRFGVAFERVCEGMRHAILSIFHSEGLKLQGLTQVVIGDKASAELQVLLGALSAELHARMDEADAKGDPVSTGRSEGAHRAAKRCHPQRRRFGKNAAFAELYATTIRPRTKQSKGAVPEIHGISAQFLGKLTGRSTELQVKLGRLQYALLQKGFKVATELAKPL